MAHRWGGTHDDPPGPDLSAQVDRVMGGRPTWRLEPQSSPGAPDLWCFGPGVDPELAVDVGPRAITLTLLDQNIGFAFADGDALASWLDANEPLFLERASLPPETYRHLLDGRIAQWRAEGH